MLPPWQDYGDLRVNVATVAKQISIRARRLKRARINAGLSLRQVESQTEIKASSISRWENGKRNLDSMQTLSRLAHLYSVSPVWLAGWEHARFDLSDQDKQTLTDLIKQIADMIT